MDYPYDVYRDSDAVLMCSRSEAMGRVTVEAMSATLPVIGYDNAGTSELIEHEHTGLLYRGEHQELASAMRRVLSDPGLAQKMGENAWKAARSKFSIEVYSRSVYDIIAPLAARRYIRRGTAGNALS